MERAWQALGLTAIDPDLPALHDSEVAALQVIARVAADYGVDLMLGLARVPGRALRRYAEAESAMLRTYVEDVALSGSGSGLATTVLR